MKLLQRASKLLKANINHLLDEAENQEVMLKELVRDMEESVSELRRETVNAVARQKQLEKKSAVAADLAAELESKATLALDHGDEELTRKILAERVEVLHRRESFQEEAKSAATLAQRIKSDLSRMQEQVGEAKRKRDELVRRKRSAEAQLRTSEAARKSSAALGEAAGNQSAFEGYADAIGEMESRAEAAEELSDNPDDSERKLRELVEKSAVDKELERLKSARASS